MNKITEEQVLNYQKSKIDEGYINSASLRFIRKNIQEKLDKKKLSFNVEYSSKNTDSENSTEKVKFLTKSLNELDEQLNLIWNTSEIIKRSEHFRLAKIKLESKEKTSSMFLYPNVYLVCKYISKLSKIKLWLSEVKLDIPLNIDEVIVNFNSAIKRMYLEDTSEEELKNMFVFLNHHFNVILNLEKISEPVKKFSQDILNDTDLEKEQGANYVYIVKGNPNDVITTLNHLNKLSQVLIIEDFYENKFSFVNLHQQKDLYVFNQFSVLVSEMIKDIYMEKQFLTLKEFKRDEFSYLWDNTKYHFSNFKEEYKYFVRIEKLVNNVLELKSRLDAQLTSEDAFNLIPYTVLTKHLSTLLNNEFRNILLFEPLLNEEPIYKISYLSKFSLDNFENTLIKVTENLIEELPNIPL